MHHIPVDSANEDGLQTAEKEGEQGRRFRPLIQMMDGHAPVHQSALDLLLERRKGLKSEEEE